MELNTGFNHFVGFPLLHKLQVYPISRDDEAVDSDINYPKHRLPRS